MQESRLFKIVYDLLEQGSSTAPELARKYEVSVRTIYRDLDAISSAGIPIYAVQGKGGGIRILDGFVLNQSLLSSQEKEQILMALQGVMATEGRNSSALLTKLGSLFQSKATNWIEVDFSNWARNKLDQNVFALIKTAIFSRNPIVFRYFGSNGESAMRHVEPMKLVFKSKDWYLHGYCLLREDFRFFKLSRIRDLEIRNESFSREMPEAGNLSKEIEEEKTITVSLKFDKKMAFRVYDEFLDRVTEDEQGYLYVQTDLPVHDGLYSYLFSFAEGVEVLEPECIRNRVKKKLSEMQNKYIT